VSTPLARHKPPAVQSSPAGTVIRHSPSTWDSWTIVPFLGTLVMDAMDQTVRQRPSVSNVSPIRIVLVVALFIVVAPCNDMANECAQTSCRGWREGVTSVAIHSKNIVVPGLSQNQQVKPAINVHRSMFTSRLGKYQGGLKGCRGSYGTANRMLNHPSIAYGIE
jgi:hypothetical protein